MAVITDVISERTAAGGVTVDGLLIKDGGLPALEPGDIGAEVAGAAATVAGALATHTGLSAGAHGISAFGATLVDDTTAANARTTLGLGTAAVANSTAFDAAGSAAAVQVNLNTYIESFPTAAVNTVGTSGASQTLSTAVGAHVVTLTANCAITLTTPASDFCRIRLRTVQGVGGGRSISFTNTVVYDYGIPPVPRTNEANITDYLLETLDGGTTWRLALIADGVAS